MKYSEKKTRNLNERTKEPAKYVKTGWTTAMQTNRPPEEVLEMRRTKCESEMHTGNVTVTWGRCRKGLGPTRSVRAYRSDEKPTFNRVREYIPDFLGLRKFEHQVSTIEGVIAQAGRPEPEPIRVRLPVKRIAIKSRHELRIVELQRIFSLELG